MKESRQIAILFLIIIGALVAGVAIHLNIGRRVVATETAVAKLRPQFKQGIFVRNETDMRSATEEYLERATMLRRYCLEEKRFKAAQSELWDMLKGFDKSGKLRFKPLPEDSAYSTYPLVGVEATASLPQAGNNPAGYSLEELIAFLRKVETHEKFLRVDYINIQADRNYLTRPADNITVVVRISALMKPGNVTEKEK